MSHKIGKIFLFRAILLLFLNFTSAEICTSEICEFTFDVHHGRSMTYQWNGKTYNVLLNGTELSPETPDRFDRPLPDKIPVEDVITADGIQRNVLTINGQIPGPTIEVMEGSQVVVHVTNYLLTQGITFHWHGMHQKGTPWMDGVAFVSQCPIIPGQSFTYRFYAYPAGTHWYHDHNTNLRIEGLYGLLVVHPNQPTLPEQHLLLTDWYHEEADTLEITHPFNSFNGAGNFVAHYDRREHSPDNVFITPFIFVSALINGRGQYNNNNAPLTEFLFQSGDTYRFRTLNAASAYSFEISIDGHMLKVISVDGDEVNPLNVDYIIIHPGERVDFTVTADQPVGNYWMRSLILRLGTGFNPVNDGVKKGTYAIVRYESSSKAMPSTNTRACTAQNVCVIFNCPWARFASGIHKRCIQVTELRSLTPMQELDEEYGLSGPVDLELFLNMGFHLGSHINGKRFLHPTLPFSDPNYLEGQVRCDRPECNMPDGGCKCTQVIKLPFNKTVQFVMANYRPASEKQISPHAMHLHGHNFAVLKLGLPPINGTTGYSPEHNTDLKCVNSFCKEVRWNIQNVDLKLQNPPIKDTVNVPARGYTVVRFRTTNPGAWFFHCHITNHVSEGMALIFDEAHDQHPAPPRSFPRCPSFKWSEADFQKYMARYSGNGERELYYYDEETYSYSKKKPNRTRERNQTPKDQTMPPAMPPGQTVDAAYLVGTVVLSNMDFIGLIVGSIAAGAALVIIVLIVVSCLNSIALNKNEMKGKKIENERF